MLCVMGSSVTTLNATAAVSVTHGEPEDARPRALWRSVAMPTEHGGWGLSAEPGLLGVLVAPSWAGLAISLAAVVAFLARTPLKLAVVDHRRGRDLPRTRLARRIAAGELAMLAVLAGTAVALSGTEWLVPLVVAAPLIAVELWFDVRSRSRRLIPELSGSVGICSVAAAVAIAGGAETRLAVALWLVLAARAVATVTFARVQVVRFRQLQRPELRADVTQSDLAQGVGLVLAVVAFAVEPSVLAGSVLIGAVTVWELFMVRRPPVRPKVLGFTQLGIGLSLVAVTALSTAIS